MRTLSQHTYFVRHSKGWATIHGASSKEAAKKIYCDMMYAPESAVWNVLQAGDLVTYHRNPTQAEINFGHGAIHYRDFPIEEVITELGRVKQWFKAQDDGLRYYR